MSASPPTLTFLFTDIEGSTRRWELQRDAMADALERHDELLRDAVVSFGGTVFKTVGDAFCAVFNDAGDALLAALAAQRAIAAEDWSAFGPAFPALAIRMALHAGEAEERGGDYFGPALNRVARILAVAHGGQTLLSEVAGGLLGGDLPPGVTLRDLGAHRLKDLTRPAHILQLVAPGLADDFPPLRSLDAANHNLPLQLTSFVGREREVDAVVALLATSRLVTLTGVGGTGKTRLALQVTAQVVDDFHDGAWFVELAPLADPAHVPGAVATVLGVREEPGRRLLDTLSDNLVGKRLLIVLDNCEHVVDGAATCAEQLLRLVSGVTVLATSRAPLGVPGEMAWAVPTLSVPPPHDHALANLSRYEAVRLFVERSAAIQPTFTITAENAPAVVEICRQLDGIPLALELAAARIRVLSPRQIAERLDERFRLLTGGGRTLPARQQTLRAAIDWSYELLPEVERRILERLSVFAGTCALDAAEAVCAGDGVTVQDVMDGLTHLVEQSLLVTETSGDEATYRQLETIRQYAAEKLVARADDAATRDRHLAWFGDVAQVAYEQYTGPDGSVGLSRLLRWHDEMRHALTWGLHSDQPARLEQAVRLTLAVAFAWGNRRLLDDLTTVVRQAWAAAESLGDPAVLALLTYWRGNTSQANGDHAAAEVDLRNALAAFRNLAMNRHEAWAVQELAMAAAARGELAQAALDLDQSIRLKRASAPNWDLAISVLLSGEVARMRGDLDLAAARYTEALQLWGSGGDPAGILWAQHNLGLVDLRRGEPHSADARLREALTGFRNVADRFGQAACLAGLGSVAAAFGNGPGSARLFGASANYLTTARLQLDPADQTDIADHLTLARTLLPPATWDEAWAEGAAMSLDEAVAYALADGCDDQAAAS